MTDGYVQDQIASLAKRITDVESILARLDRIESKLDEVLEYVRMVQSPEYIQKQNEIDFNNNVLADLLVEIMKDIRDSKRNESNGDNIRKEN